MLLCKAHETLVLATEVCGLLSYYAKQADGDSAMAEESSTSATDASAEAPAQSASAQPLIPEVELYAYLLTLLLFTDQQKYELVRNHVVHTVHGHHV